MVSRDANGGVPEAGSKAYEASSGRPVRLNKTGWAVPEVRPTATLNSADPPALIDWELGSAEMEKSNPGGGGGGGGWPGARTVM